MPELRADPRPRRPGAAPACCLGVLATGGVAAAAIVYVGLGVACHRTSYGVARGQIEAFKAALAMYEVDHGHYPQGTPTPLDDDGPALYRALCLPPEEGGGVHAPYLNGWKEEYVDATDPRGPVLLDPWGRPFRYREWASYSDAAKQALEDLDESHAIWTDGRVVGRVPDEPHDHGRFDIWSDGPNGVNEYGSPCSDDVTSWSRYEPHGPCACPDLPSPEVRRRANEVVAATGLYLLLLAFPAALVWHAGRPKPLPPRVVLRGAALEGTRCAFCHDGSDGATTACASCGALLHADCWGIAGRCPTLGCGPPRPRPASPGPGPGAPLTIVVRAAA